ncbi:ABC transporter ATP-binding protein [Citrobacter amalonaticus]|nr:ABC transporter ATP-binding protein [Citrobacter amalonaticus]
MTDTTAFITLENISKQFPGVLALDNVNLTLKKGEVHCLAGQNGCGKSTIIKVISGVYQPEKGAQILLDGKLFHQLSPQLSSHYGIQVIYQDLSSFLTSAWRRILPSTATCPAATFGCGAVR